MLLSDCVERVLIQGATGRVASRHADHMRAYGTNVVAGVAPGKAGESVGDLPVFNTVAAAVEATGATSTVAFLPPAAVSDGLIEAAEAGLGLAVSVTEGVGLHDFMEAHAAAARHQMRIVGPNCPGFLSAGQYLLGFLPVTVVKEGSCAVISRSGTLSYEVVYALGQAGLGVSLWVGIGGDRVKGSTFVDLIPDALADPRTEALVLVGEIGGRDEQEAAQLLAQIDLPAVALLAGSTAPAGVSLGHAGAIIDGAGGSYEDKRTALEAAGVIVAKRPMDVATEVARLLNERNTR